MNTITLYVVRAKEDFKGPHVIYSHYAPLSQIRQALNNIIAPNISQAQKDWENNKWSSANPYAFKKDWYLTSTYIKPEFKKARFYDSENRAWASLKALAMTRTVINLSGMTMTDIFEVVPVSVIERK